MGTNPRHYPDTMISPESGRTMVRGEKLLSLEVGAGHGSLVRWMAELDHHHVRVLIFGDQLSPINIPHIQSINGEDGFMTLVH